MWNTWLYAHSLSIGGRGDLHVLLLGTQSPLPFTVVVLAVKRSSPKSSFFCNKIDRNVMQKKNSFLWHSASLAARSKRMKTHFAVRSNDAIWKLPSNKKKVGASDPGSMLTNVHMCNTGNPFPTRRGCCLKGNFPLQSKKFRVDESYFNEINYSLSNECGHNICFCTNMYCT